ncbi:pyrroline-5-carboxylate reductase 3 isoform X1 [Syngnathoides biaculeatus]|uniref:pyrroline-5-carboxylate reductase 3 isoform X1 n=1 Tax=Syngnathoides biaculeatus TaxID=300417 RepID=UPI002ADE114A|nr:pyrroline-5-carboxylate reductase 3 isoform X1 [Syngnathoides biaculeatus]
MFWGYGRKPECPAKTHGGTGRTYKLTQVGPDMNPDPQNCEANNPQLLHHAAHIKSEPKMDSQFRIGFIGAGNIAFGIAKGILSGSVLPTNVKVSAPSPRNLGRFQELNISTSHSNTEVVCHSDVIFVAVKPHIVPTVLSEISQHVTNRHTIVSVAAGVTLATLEELLPEGSCVIRLMPNLPCVVLEGALLFARGTCAKQEHGALLCSLLHCCGLVEEGPEAWLDIHTGLSGSGVAFVYLFAEALADGAVKMGMPSTLAQRIASQTVLGAGHLLRNSNKHPAQLRSEVCTPGGTTIFGLHALEQGGVRASTITAVESATERARELGQMSAAPGSRK